MERSTEFNDVFSLCKDIVLRDEELEGDIRRLRSMIVATYDYFSEIYEKHCDSPGFELVHQHLCRAIGDHEELLKVLPKE